LKQLILFIVVVAALGGAIIAYQTYFQKEPVTSWELIPDNALAVYESAKPLEAWNEWKNSNIGGNLLGIESFKKTSDFVSKLDTLLGGEEKTAQLLDGQTFLTSLHSTGSNALDFLFVLEVPTLDKNDMLSSVLGFYSEKNGFVAGERSYLGYTLREIKAGKEVFTFLYYQNLLVGSFTAFLVEDAIRNIEGESIGFFIKNPMLLTLAKLQNDQGNLYVNTSKLDKLADTFLSEKAGGFQGVGSLGASTFMDLKVTEQQLLMSGFTLLPQGYVGSLSGFVGNPATAVSLEDMVSNRASIFMGLTFGSAALWNTQMQPYWTKTDSAISELRSASLAKYDINIQSLYETLGTQAGVAIQESSFGKETDKVVYIGVKDFSESIQLFDQLTERINLSQGDTVYYEDYSGYTIKQLEVEELPYQLFGHPFKGFSSLYYTGHRNFIIGAGSVQILKSLIDDITSDNTWGRSVAINSFLENTLSEANLSIFVHSPRAWDQLTQHLDPAWLEPFNQQATRLQAVELMAFQWSYIEDKFYTSVVLQQTTKTSPAPGQKPLLADQSLTFAQSIASQPFVVRNHADRSLETLVQDSSNLLYLLSPVQEVLWIDSLKESINSPVYQIDYYKNGKLQYLFSTPGYIYAIDRTGEYLPGFPVEFKSKNKIAYFSLVDYDKSREYRYFFADTKGNLYITDKDGKALDGWGPKEMKYQVAAAPFHVRVRGQDFLISIQTNGVLNVFNRRGQQVAGFPVDLKAGVNNQVFAEAGSTVSNTKLTTITDDGAIIQLSLAGKVLQREQLYRPSPQSKFRLVPESSGNGFVFTRQDANRIAIADQGGKVLFEKDYLSTATANAQFYDWGGGRQLFVINDPAQGLSYLYNEKGDLANLKPIETTNSVAIIFYESQGHYKIYRGHKNEFSILTLNK